MMKMPESSSEKRKKYRAGFEDLATNYETPDEYSHTAERVLSEDTDEAMACFDVFYSPFDVGAIAMVVSGTENNEVKLELAKILDPVANTKLIFESDYPFDKESKKEHLDHQIEITRKNFKRMMEHSDGEAKKIFEKKAQEFEKVVKEFEMKK